MEKIDWENLGFEYIKTPYRYIAYYKDGEWQKGELTTDNKLHISEGSAGLHYGQQLFEGLKAYMRKDGKINLFRIDENSKRLNAGARRLFMPEVPYEMFKDAIYEVVKANRDYIPPYGSGASLYLRPLLFGVGDNLGVKPADEFIFTVFCSPVGKYFKNGLAPSNFMISDYDRAAPVGTGDVKAGGNYAASLLPGKVAKKKGFADCIYLDPKTHTKIEEVGAANFFGITKDNKFVTPTSTSILPSITKFSLMQIAKDRLGMEVEERDIYIDKLDELSEAGACGTAAVISPIGGIEYDGKLHVFYSETEVGPVTKQLYDELVGIQTGDKEPIEGWIFEVE